MKKLRIGLVGVGKIGLAQIKAIKAIEPSGYVELVAISTRNEAKGAEVSAEYGIPAHFTDYRTMLADADLDLVHNCTPNVVHFVINKAILESGRHALSEKPLTVDSAQSSELVALADSRHARTAINFVYRHYSAIQRLKNFIASGGLGAIRAVHGTYLQDWLALESDYDWRVESRLGGPSRAFADIGSHWIDMVQFLIGQNVESLMADFATFIPVRFARGNGTAGDYGVDSTPHASDTTSEDTPAREVKVDTEDFASLLFHFDGGAHGCLTVSQVSPGRRSGLSFEIDGSAASARWSHDRPDIVLIGRRGEAEQILSVRDGNWGYPERSPGCGRPLGVDGKNCAGKVSEIGRRSAGQHSGQGEKDHAPAEGFPDAQRNLIDNFYRSILFAEPQTCADFAQGHQVVEIVEAAVQSARSGLWTKVSHRA